MIFRIQDFHRQFGSNDKCLEHLFRLRFPKPVCVKCERTNAYHRHPTKHCYTCNCGQSHIYPKKGTIFQGSPISLTKWFYALQLMTQDDNGISAKDLQRKLEVAYPTAWRMAMKIRGIIPSFQDTSTPKTFDGLLMSCVYDEEQVKSNK